MDEIRILLFAANPTQDLRLDKEIRAIEDGLRESSYRKRVRLVSALAARPKDLISRLNENRPNVVHFSGHGLGGPASGDGTRHLIVPTDAPEAQVVLVDEATGGPKAVGQQALVNLFRTRRPKIRLVVLNACWTSSQARAISAEVDCVVGTNRAIGDEAARVFSARFYHTLADGGSVQQAFDDARVELELHGIPESATPVLNCREGVDPEQVVLLGPDDAAAMPRAAEPAAKRPGERAGAPDRLGLVRNLSNLAPSDWSVLVTMIPGAASHVSRQGTVTEQVAELVRWAESPTGPGLAAIQEAYKGLLNP
jgi:hypothetical protein